MEGLLQRKSKPAKVNMEDEAEYLDEEGKFFRLPFFSTIETNKMDTRTGETDPGTANTKWELESHDPGK